MSNIKKIQDPNGTSYDVGEVKYVDQLPSSSNIDNNITYATSGTDNPLPISAGGTGATTAADARDNLGIAPNFFQAFSGSNVSLTSNTTTLIPMDNIEYNVGDMFSLSDGSVVCSKAGHVEISAQIDTNISTATAEQCYIFLYKNGSNTNNLTRTTLSTSSYTTATFTTRVISVASGDELSLHLHLTTGTSGTAQGGRFFNHITLRYLD